jgi:hypothetical protein
MRYGFTLSALPPIFFINSWALQQHLSSSIHAPRTFSNQQAIEQRLDDSAPASLHECNVCNRELKSQHALDQHLSSLAHNKPVSVASLTDGKFFGYIIVLICVLNQHLALANL